MNEMFGVRMHPYLGLKLLDASQQRADYFFLSFFLSFFNVAYNACIYPTCRE